MNSTQARISMNIILVASMLFFPWWTTLLCIVLALFLFSAYEVLLWVFIADFLYGTSLARFYNLEYLMVFFAALLLLGVFAVKRRMIFYREM